MTDFRAEAIVEAVSRFPLPGSVLAVPYFVTEDFVSFLVDSSRPCPVTRLVRVGVDTAPAAALMVIDRAARELLRRLAGRSPEPCPWRQDGPFDEALAAARHRFERGVFGGDDCDDPIGPRTEGES